MNLETIKKADQADTIHCYWIMLGECEALADNSNDATLKTQVEGFFRHWNKMTGDNKQPRWLTRNDPQRSNTD